MKLNNVAASPSTEQSASHPSPRRASAATSKSASLRRWGTVVYAVVAGAMLMRLLTGLAAVRRVRRRAVELDALPGGIPVLEADVAAPLAVGFGKPAIVLPRGLRRAVAPGELRDVLAHEAEHLRRGDHWVMLLQGVAAAMYWPIVTVHLLNRALARAREELCDNAVLAGRDPAAYGQTLLAVAEQLTGRRTFVSQLAPSVVRRGDLERRVAGLLDSRRDRRARVSRPVRWTVAVSLLAFLVIAGTTRVAAVADESAESEVTTADPSAVEPPGPKTDISWTGIPKVDLDNPTLHRGVVLGPDGSPLAGASVYAASTIELLELADEDEATIEGLGPVRAVTDELGRFEFDAPDPKDLSWITPAGEQKRWETLLVATKEGVAPGWLKTWGADRSLRSHWHPMKDREVAVRTRPPATLTGTLLLEGGAPLAGARVRLIGLMAPVGYDLDVHFRKEEVRIPKEEEAPLPIFTTIDYAETLYRPWVLPGLETETITDDDGRFELSGLPEGFFARIEVRHPEAVTTRKRFAVRSFEPVDGQGEPKLTLRGSGFTAELAKGAVLRGRVDVGVMLNRGPAADVIVAQANQNAKDGMVGQTFRTDAEGRFEVTGLHDTPQGYELAFVGSFAAPFAGRRERVVPGAEARVELPPAARYRLKLTDPEGNPVDRTVYSIQVQQVPGAVRRDVKNRFNDAERVAPGVYEGIVPIGPGAVLVKRGAKSDRPAAVDPKAYFAPGRTDWTRDEQRYAFGDAWRIARPAVVTSESYTVSKHGSTTDQLELAAVAFTNAKANDEGVLELTATVHSDPPVEVTLVDEEGNPVAGAEVERQLERYNGKDLPAMFSVYGLHPERAEFLAFTHEERGLIGTLSTTWTSEPMQVLMRPAATLIGRVVHDTGIVDLRDFGIRVLGDGVMPDTIVGGRAFNITDEPGERKGEIRLVVPPAVEVRGEFIRKTAPWATRPSAGTAFGPLVPEPGETVELGDLVVP